MNVVIPALVALVVGALSSLAAPWAVWGVEKRREERAHRRALIAEWRLGVAQLSRTSPDTIIRNDIIGAPWYVTIRRYLSEDAVYSIEGDRVRMQMRGVRVNPEVELLLSEIDRIETIWGL